MTKNFKKKMKLIIHPKPSNVPILNIRKVTTYAEISVIAVIKTGHLILFVSCLITPSTAIHGT